MRLGPFGYYADLFVGLAIVALQIPLLLWGATWQHVMEWLACGSMGVVLWTVLEYVIHR